MPTEPQHQTHSEKFRMVTVEDQLRCQKDTQSKLQKIEHILIGADGKNGIRSDVQKLERETEREIAELKKTAQDYQRFKSQFLVIFLPLNGILTAVVTALIIKLVLN